jgi:hypothetical protein
MKTLKPTAVLCAVLQIALGVFLLNCATSNAAPAKMARTKVYAAPQNLDGRIIGFATDYEVKVNGQKSAVYDADPNDLYQTTDKAIKGWNPNVFTAFDLGGSASLEVRIAKAPKKAEVFPRHLGIKTKISGNKIAFTLKNPANFALVVDGNIGRPLWIFANPPETQRPDANDPNVKFFKAGQFYDVGKVKFDEYSTVYIEGGAIVRGAIEGGEKGPGVGAKKVLGRGILCNLEDKCAIIGGKNTLISGPIMVGQHKDEWTFILFGCDGAVVDNVKVFGLRRDAFDPTGCRNLVARNCFFWSYDDSVAIKSFPLINAFPVENILIENSVLANHGPVVGYESDTDYMRKITFRNLDVLWPRDNTGMKPEDWNLRVGVLKIDVPDRARVSDILYENIRIHDPETVDLFGVRIFDFYTPDTHNGQLENVTFRNIFVEGVKPNQGWARVKGLSSEHMPKNIRFENIVFDGKKAKTAADLKLQVFQHVDPAEIHGVEFRGNAPNFALNASFEEEVENRNTAPNWAESAGEGENPANTGASFVEARPHEAAAGTAILTHWADKAFRVLTLQALSSLPTGTYTVRASAFRTGSEGVSQMQVSAGAAKKTVAVPHSQAMQTLVISNVKVTDGRLTIGFFTDVPGAQASKFDSVEVIRSGP